MKKRTITLLFASLIVTATVLFAVEQPTVVPATISASSAPISLAADPKRIPLSDSVKIPELDLSNNDIRDVLRGIGMQYGLNIYLEPEVTGKVSIFLTKIAVADAVKFIVQRQGYDYVVENSIVKVFKPKVEPAPLVKAPVVFSHAAGKLTVDFHDLCATDVARNFVDSADVNVVVESGHSKTVSGKLKALPVGVAIKTLYESAGMEVVEKNGIYYVNSGWGESSSSSSSKSSSGGNSSKPRRTNVLVDSLGLVSFDVTNASIDDLVRSMILERGLNIMIYQQIQGAITARCERTPLDDALRFLLQNTDFTFWKDKDIYFIGSREMSQQRTSTMLPLKHIRAEEKVIGPLIPPILTKNAVIKYDSEHNALIVTGSFDVVEEAREFISKIDKPIPQVLIEALVVDFNVSKIRSLGLSVFMGGKGDGKNDGKWDEENYLPNLNLKPGTKRMEGIINDVLAAAGSTRVIQLPDNFRVNLEALEGANIVKVNSTPQIATISGNPASLTIGETRYYKLLKETKSGTTGGDAIIGTDERFEEKKFNTILKVTPWVMDDGHVMVEVNPEFNIPRSGGDEKLPPTIDTRVLLSMVRLKHNETIVLGGYRANEEMVNRKGIPFLSSIPILGTLFSSKTVSSTETQMMIFLTPRIYYADDVSVRPDQKFGHEINKVLDNYDEGRRDARQELRDEMRTLERVGEKQQRETNRELREMKRVRRTSRNDAVPTDSSVVDSPQTAMDDSQITRASRKGDTPSKVSRREKTIDTSSQGERKKGRLKQWFSDRKSRNDDENSTDTRPARDANKEIQR